jgi:hypothetical protein
VASDFTKSQIGAMKANMQEVRRKKINGRSATADQLRNEENELKQNLLPMKSAKKKIFNHRISPTSVAPDK